MRKGESSYYTTNILLPIILSRFNVTVEGYWIDSWIYWVTLQLHTITVYTLQ
jgi:hypothetical protein